VSGLARDGLATADRGAAPGKTATARPGRPSDGSAAIPYVDFFGPRTMVATATVGLKEGGEMPGFARSPRTRKGRSEPRRRVPASPQRLAPSVVVAAGVHPSVAIPNRIAAVVVATVAANEEDLATMKSVSPYMLVHDMPVEACTVPGTRHCAEANGTGLSSAHAPDMAA
jgi:hypothetical protein